MHKVDWSKVKYFSRSEFNGQADLVEDELIYRLDGDRARLGERIFISKANGAIARVGAKYKKSQHYVGDSLSELTRLSTAVDVFIEGTPMANLFNLVNSNQFSGIGLYRDTIGNDGEPWMMFHLDIRKPNKRYNPLIWVCTKEIDAVSGKTKNRYLYPQADPRAWKLLYTPIFFKQRKHL